MQKSLESFFRKTHIFVVNNNYRMIASGSKKRTSDEAGMPTLSAETGSKMKKVKFQNCLNISIYSLILNPNPKRLNLLLVSSLLHKSLIYV